MEAQPSLKPRLARASPSFRLRSPSLNNLRLRRVFDLFDHNGDGEITVDELCGALDRLGLNANPADTAALVSPHIRPGRAGLGFDDFQGLHRALGDALFGEAEAAAGAEEADMVEAFNVFDEDGDGFISAKELHAVLGKLGLQEGQSIDRVQMMICSVDRNSDGRVDFREFKHMMQGITVNGS